MTKEIKEELQILENKLKLDEEILKCLKNEDYFICKLKLEEMNEVKANGVKIRRKCDWYEYGKKFFLNLEKDRFFQSRSVNW